MSSTRFTLIVSSILQVVVCAGCNGILGPALVGSGVPTTESREVESFSAVRIGGAMKAHVTIGDDVSVKISGDDNLVPLVTTEVRDGTLEIRLDHNGRVSTKNQLVAKIVTPQLSKVDISGASSIVAEGVSADGFDAEISGASALIVSGQCQNLTADISGASSLKAENFSAVDADIETSGASSAKVNVSQSLSANASGASSIKYSGNPAKVIGSDSGASSVKPIKN